MDIMQTIYAKAKAKPMQVAFPEAESEKILRAAAECHKEGICCPVLVGDSEKVDKVVEAVGIAHALRPELKIDGEFQLDAAIIPAIAAKKVGRESAVAGKANIIIWPDLNVGNIGVKLVQQFGHADAYGPMLQGFAKIVCDCSRSAPVSELVGNVAMSCVRAQETR